MRIQIPFRSIINDKAKISAIAFILLLFISAMISIIPATFGYTAMPDRDTGTVVSASPTRIGLGQQVLINIFTYPAPAGPTAYAQDLVTKFDGLDNVWVSITKPDGTTSTYMPVDSTLANIGINKPGHAQIVGSLMFYYTPDQIGNYTISGEFKGDTYTTDDSFKALNLSVYYKPSASKAPATFTVQTDPVLAGQLNGWPWSPFPKDFWQNPVSTNNREWAQISGDWSQSTYDALATRYNPYSTAPQSAHIVWANQVSQGGLPGGDWGSDPYNGGGGAATVILDGKIYQSGKSGYFDCIDLQTGKTLWSAPGTVSLAQRIQPFYQTASQVNEGGIAVWLWGISGSNWVRYNPFNGDVMQNITGAPTDLTARLFSDGDPIVICAQSSLTNFNTTMLGKIRYANLIKWNYTKVTNNNWMTGIEWNVSAMQPDLQVSIGDNGFRGLNAWVFPDANVIVAKTPNAMQIMAGYDYKTGAFLWRNNNTVFDLGVNTAIATSRSGPLFMHCGADNKMVAYDIKTGNELYRITQGELPFGVIPNYVYAYNPQTGTFYHGSYDGHLYAVNLADGKSVWQSDYTGDEEESIYGHQPMNGQIVGAEGTLYISSATVYSLMPRTRFHDLWAINETTGHFIWKLPIGAQPRAIADGYLVAADSENGIQYGIGKGQTKTAVTAPLTTVSSGTAVLIQGTITDQSPGLLDTQVVSDADMSEWMSYKFGQNATLINNPPMPKGVPVTLRAVDTDGNVYDIGTTTSDQTGFKFAWTPPKVGLYTVTATFDGSESYWGSWSGTALNVAEAAQTTTAPTATPLAMPPFEMYFVASTIAIIVAVAIVGLMLKKRP